MELSWLALQFADSAFPVGGFAHSSGLEAMVQMGACASVGELRSLVRESVVQAGQGALPFVAAAHRAPDRLSELDARSNAFLCNAVANRASVTQGRALIDTAARIFSKTGEVASLKQSIREAKLHCHHAPVFGALMRALALKLEETLAVYLNLNARGFVLAAVRLGVVGPHEAQRILFEITPLLDETLRAGNQIDLEEIAQTAPLIDLFQGTHDRLYSRLFLS